MSVRWVLSCIEAQAGARPGHPAVHAAGSPAHEQHEQEISYRALWRMVCEQRSRLEQCQGGSGDLLALHGGRGVQRIATMLGAWQAGVAVLPLDPQWPAARREDIARRAGAQLHAADTGDLCRSGPPRGQNEGLAYVVYSSGSTGQPKGVEVTGDGLRALIQAQQRAFRLGADARALWMLGLGFDASFSDVLTALTAGATLVLAPDAGLAPSELATFLDRYRVTHADVPPAYLTRLARDPLPPHLRTLVVGGEAPPSAAVRALAERVRLVNVYGPTEATVCTSLVRCGTDWSAPRIGAPLPGVRYRLEPVRTGATGGDPGQHELWIGGACLARGYRDDLASTRTRFVTVDAERFFRTGDLVRRDPTGDLCFVGRVDRQLKVRGQLVCPEEVEAQALDVPGVDDVRVYWDSNYGLVAEIETCADPERLRAQLLAAWSQTLPAYAIPSVVRYSAVRRAAGALKRVTGSAPSSDYVFATGRAPHRATAQRDAPSGRLASDTRLIRLLASRALGRDIAADDDFFEAGGDSLVALELAAEAQAMGRRVPHALWARHRTPRGVARALGVAGPADPLPGGGAATLLTDLVKRVPDAPNLPPSESLTHVLVTGGTGSLGRPLVAVLLAQTGLRITVLSRSVDERRRAQHPRLTFLRGDLRAPHFGIGAAPYRWLARDIDGVIHLAAHVTGMATYDDLAPVHVDGTRRVLDFAALERPKRVAYASTLSVLTCLQPARPAQTQLGAALVGGYPQSKWVAEQQMLRTEAALVVRLGLLTGTGTSHLERVARGLAAIGGTPASACASWRFDVTPVEFAARRFVDLFLRHDTRRSALHHLSAGSGSLEELRASFAAEGASLAALPAEVFWSRALPGGADARLAAMSFLRALAPRDHERARALDLFQTTGLAPLSRDDDPALVRRALRGYVREAVGMYAHAPMSSSSSSLSSARRVGGLAE